MQILRYEEIKYGRNDDEIYGVLFDGAWLWEEYLNTILKDCGYNHPQNRMRTGRVYLFTDKTGYRYPDFYKDDIVLDAKYRRYAHLNLQKINGEDLHQVITYMYIMAANHGGVIVPWPYQEQEIQYRTKVLEGHYGKMSILGITVDTPADNYKSYCQQMAQFEREFVNHLPKSGIEVIEHNVG